jgi:hypothetical protein
LHGETIAPSALHAHTKKFLQIERPSLDRESLAQQGHVPQRSTRRGRGEIVIMLIVVGHGDGCLRDGKTGDFEMYGKTELVLTGGD